MLGAHAESFGLDEWLMTGAAARAALEPGVIPDWWTWLQAETLREAERRGLPTATAGSLSGPSTAELARDVAALLGIDPATAGIPRGKSE